MTQIHEAFERFVLGHFKSTKTTDEGILRGLAFFAGASAALYAVTRARISGLDGASLDAVIARERAAVDASICRAAVVVKGRT